MSRTVIRRSPGTLVMRVRALVACVVMVALLAPSAAWALTPYSIHWVINEAAGSCETAELGGSDGVAFFDVNGTPIPTYQVPGAFVKNADGSETNVAEAGFDSVLLHMGANEFYFGATIASGVRMPMLASMNGMRDTTPAARTPGSAAIRASVSRKNACCWTGDG